jgi:hypothetical protein
MSVGPADRDAEVVVQTLMPLHHAPGRPRITSGEPSPAQARGPAVADPSQPPLSVAAAPSQIGKSFLY